VLHGADAVARPGRAGPAKSQLVAASSQTPSNGTGTGTGGWRIAATTSELRARCLGALRAAAPAPQPAGSHAAGHLAALLTHPHSSTRPPLGAPSSTRPPRSGRRRASSSCRHRRWAADDARREEEGIHLSTSQVRARAGALHLSSGLAWAWVHGGVPGALAGSGVAHSGVHQSTIRLRPRPFRCSTRIMVAEAQAEGPALPPAPPPPLAHGSSSASSEKRGLSIPGNDDGGAAEVEQVLAAAGAAAGERGGDGRSTHWDVGERGGDDRTSGDGNSDRRWPWPG
jgi:hypothetical protein